MGTYDEKLQSLKEIERLAWEAGAEDRKIAAENQRIAAEKRAVEQRIASEKRAEEQRNAAEKQRIADSKPTVKEDFYSNGKLLRRINYQPKSDGGKLHGPWEYYYENGQLNNKKNYKDGKKDGLFEMYFENGDFLSKICYANDKMIDMSYCEK